MKAFIEKSYQVDENITVSYSDTSSFINNKPVLVFLHGLGGDLNAFDKFRSKFYSHDYRSIAIDFRGHGLSTRVRERKHYDLEEFALDVIKILEKENIQNYVLIGHCLGGLVAQKIAVKNPKELNKIILINVTPVIFPMFQNIGFAKFIKYLAIILEKILPKNHFGGRINHEDYIGTGDFYVPRIFNDLTNTSIASYGQILSYLINFNILDEVKNILAPTLVISGSKDRVFPTKWSRQINANIPNSRLIIYDEGNHLFLFSSVKSVTKDIIDFLNE